MNVDLTDYRLDDTSGTTELSTDPVHSDYGYDNIFTFSGWVIEGDWCGHYQAYSVCDWCGHLNGDTVDCNNPSCPNCWEDQKNRDVTRLTAKFMSVWDEHPNAEAVPMTVFPSEEPKTIDEHSENWTEAKDRVHGLGGVIETVSAVHMFKTDKTRAEVKQLGYDDTREYLRAETDIEEIPPHKRVPYCRENGVLSKDYHIHFLVLWEGWDSYDDTEKKEYLSQSAAEGWKINIGLGEGYETVSEYEMWTESQIDLPTNPDEFYTGDYQMGDIRPYVPIHNYIDYMLTRPTIPQDHETRIPYYRTSGEAHKRVMVESEDELDRTDLTPLEHTIFVGNAETVSQVDSGYWAKYKREKDDDCDNCGSSTTSLHIVANNYEEATEDMDRVQKMFTWTTVEWNRGNAKPPPGHKYPTTRDQFEDALSEMVKNRYEGITAKHISFYWARIDKLSRDTTKTDSSHIEVMTS